MRKRQFAATVAVTVITASSCPVAAHADSTTTIYVSGLNTQCSDTGIGTEVAPFCTLQAGIDAASPGDTVLVSGGTYKPVAITNSGTPAQPITISGNTNAHVVGAKGSTAAAFTFTNVSYVTVSDFQVQAPTPRYAYVSGSNHVTIDGLLGDVISGLTTGQSQSAFEITGDSSFVTVSRNEIIDSGRQAPTVQIDAGSTGDAITTNGIEFGDPAIAVNNAPGTDVTSNTLVYPTPMSCGTGIDLAGASTNSFIENNVVVPAWTYCNAPTTLSGLVSVDAAATPGTTVDFNTLDLNQPLDGETYAYEWAGNFYPTAAAFTAATGQGAHDLYGEPYISMGNGFRVQPNAGDASVINNANSAAPGELATDVNRSTRVDDPLYPDSGSGPFPYYDRGAAQIQPDTAANTVTTTAVGPLGVSAMSQDWSTTGYTYDFGDRTPAVSGVHGAAQHTYTRAGTYTITVSGTSEAGTPFTDSTSFATSDLGADRLYDNNRGTNGLWWSSWDQGPANSVKITQAAVTAMPNDDLQVVAVTTGGTLEHSVYHSSNGGWQDWGIPANNATPISAAIAGMPDGSSQLIEVTSTGMLEHDVRNANGSWQPQGWGSPAGSTGIAQAAITAMPDGSTQLLAVTTTGVLEHNIRSANGVWQGWRELSQPGVKVVDASIAGMPNGSSQIIEVTSAGVLEHNIRNANGTWQPQGWGSPAGSTGIAQASITAMPDGSTQFAAVTTTGVLEHNVRNANGSWQPNGWGAPAQTDMVAAVTSPSIAGLPNGSSQIIEVSTN